jgi:lysophospholipase L1-like esterase
VLGLTSCGSAQPTISSVAGDGVTVAALGDSITAGNPAYDPDPAQRAALGFGDDVRSQYEYWAERADPRLEFRNCGVFGERTDEIAARLDDCADGAEALIVQGGINDIAQGRPVDAAAADLHSIAARGKRLGLDVYLADVLPWNNGQPLADRPIGRLNRAIETIGRDAGVEVIGFHDELEDQGRAGVMAPRLTADGDHPSIAGYRRLGRLVAARLGAG